MGSRPLPTEIVNCEELLAGVMQRLDTLGAEDGTPHTLVSDQQSARTVENVEGSGCG